jgi:hypothetical protein
MLYYLDRPIIQRLTSPASPYWSITPVKNKILTSLVPGLRKKSKGTGYENLKALLHESKQMLGALMPENIGDTRPYLTYEQVLSKLRGTQ